MSRSTELSQRPVANLCRTLKLWGASWNFSMKRRISSLVVVQSVLSVARDAWKEKTASKTTKGTRRTSTVPWLSEEPTTKKMVKRCYSKMSAHQTTFCTSHAGLKVIRAWQTLSNYWKVWIRSRSRHKAWTSSWRGGRAPTWISKSSVDAVNGTDTTRRAALEANVSVILAEWWKQVRMVRVTMTLEESILQRRLWTSLTQALSLERRLSSRLLTLTRNHSLYRTNSI